VERRHLLGTHAAGHGLAPEDPGGCGGVADRARLAVDPLGAVAGGLTGEAMTLHRTGEALALADGGHVDELTVFDDVDRDLLADLVAGDVVEAEFEEAFAGGDVGLLVLTGDGLGQLAHLLLSEGDLERAVAVLLR